MNLADTRRAVVRTLCSGALALVLLPTAPAVAQTVARTVAPAVAQTANINSAVRIPAVKADTLAGAHVQLPEDLHGRSGILVLGFGKDSRTQVRDWGKRLAQDYFSSPTVLYYEIAVIAGVPRFARGLVLHSIAAEVSDRGKQHFLPVTDNEDRWRALANYKAPNVAYVLVLDGAGRVLWQTSGELTDTAYQAVQQHLPQTP